MTRRKSILVRWVFPLVILACAGIFFATRPSEPQIPVSQFFAYDPQVPLNPEMVLVSETEEYTVSHVVFSSVHKARVPGVLYVPKSGPGPFPAILYQHGATNSKDGAYIVKGLELFARSGFVAMAIDAELHGERQVEGLVVSADSLLTMPPVELRNAVIQTIVDLRRATDFLREQPSVDPQRIGYMGVSLGGIMGATVVGLDPKIKACILAVAGGGFGSMARFAKITPEMKQMAKIVEPLNFVADIAPRPILMINATKDEYIPKIATDLLYAKARQPKSIVWMDSKHELPVEEALALAQKFFNENL